MASHLKPSQPLKIAFIHPDLGIGGAERLVVDAALGLQKLGHSVEIFTSYHDPGHSFEETNNGSLRVQHISTFIPRSIRGALHIYLAILRQMHLLMVLLYRLEVGGSKMAHDVYIVDQLSACIPLLRWATGRRVVFYCHFPDKLLASGKEAVVDGSASRIGLLKWLYRAPANWIEEKSTSYADVLLANSRFTADVFRISFPSILKQPQVVYPGINLEAYESPVPDDSEPDLKSILSTRPTFLSLNRFERKKNVALAINAFAHLKKEGALTTGSSGRARLVIGGGYDPRLPDNVETLSHLAETCKASSLSYSVVTNGTSPVTLESDATTADTDITFILNFTTIQRQYLLRSPHTLCLLYTPGNEHFGIGPVEGMACGLPVVACTSGGPTESLVDIVANPGWGSAWLCDPDPAKWAGALKQVLGLSLADREALAGHAKSRVQVLFSMDKMARGFENALKRAVKGGLVDDAPLVMIKPLHILGIGLLALTFWFQAKEMYLTSSFFALLGFLNCLLGLIRLFRM